MAAEQVYPIAETVKFIVLNSGSFHPTEITRSTTKHGDYRRMVDGTLKYYHRGVYSKWDISWKGLHESELESIRAVYAFYTEFTFTNEFEESYTVACLPDGLKTTFSATTISALSESIFYDVDLTIEQVYPITSGDGSPILSPD